MRAALGETALVPADRFSQHRRLGDDFALEGLGDPTHAVLAKTGDEQSTNKSLFQHLKCKIDRFKNKGNPEVLNQQRGSFEFEKHNTWKTQIGHGFNGI